MNKQALFYIFIPVLFLSCSKDFRTMNDNPKAPQQVPAATLFLNGEKNLVDLYTSTAVSVAPFRVLAQAWTENTYIYEAQYNLANYQSPDNWWARLYGVAVVVDGVSKNVSVLNNLEAAKKAFPLEVFVPEVLRNDLIITDILEVFTYHMLTATYGNIPYKQAVKDSIPYPVYDDARTVYNDLMLRLDTCIAGLNTNAAAMGVADQIYKGNTARWKRFAATLKLKMALMMADADAGAATIKAGEAIQAGLFQSAADNATLLYDPSSPRNSNPLWQALVYSGRNDFVPSELLVNTMVGWNDPRVPYYFTKDPNDGYSGGVPGTGNGYGIYSDFSAAMQEPDYPGLLMDYSEAEFLLAEAAERGIAVPGAASEHYAAAIRASILFWGGSDGEADAYLAEPAVAYGTAVGGWRQKIGYQKWISFYNRNWDAWTEIRRLGYPDLNTVSPPVGAQGELPLRFNYPSKERSANAVHWQQAAKTLPGGSDVVSAKLWWMQ